MKHLSDNELINYISGKLSDDWNKQIEQHLSVCTECRETATFLQEMHGEWEMPSSSPSLNFTEDIISKIGPEVERYVMKPKTVQFKKVIPKKQLKYIHFAMAAAAMIFFSQVGLGDLIKEKSIGFIGTSSKKVNQATITFTKGVKTVNKLTEKQFKKMEELKNEKTK